MSNLAPTSCVVAEKLHAIEQRLRQNCRQAQSHLAQAGYGQASLEIARESIAHFHECVTCQAALAEELRVAA